TSSVTARSQCAQCIPGTVYVSDSVIQRHLPTSSVYPIRVSIARGSVTSAEPDRRTLGYGSARQPPLRSALDLLPPPCEPFDRRPRSLRRAARPSASRSAR